MDIRPSDKRVLDVIIADKNQNYTCFPMSVTDSTGMEEKWVMKCIGRLTSNGLIVQSNVGQVKGDPYCNASYVPTELGMKTPLEWANI